MAPLLKHEWIKKTSYLYAIIPIYSLIQMPGIDYSVGVILKSLTGIYVLFLVAKFFINNALVRNIMMIIGIIYFCFEPFLISDIYTGIYIGVVGLVVLIVGYVRKDSFPLFVTGLIMTIINIV